MGEATFAEATEGQRDKQTVTKNSPEGRSAEAEVGVSAYAVAALRPQASFEARFSTVQYG